MAAALGALVLLLAPVTPLQVTVPDPRTVALLFQPVLLRCHYQTVASDPPIVTWKYKSFCPQGGGGTGGGPEGGPEVPSPCPDATRTVRIVATKQGGTVTLGDFYRGRGVTILGGAELSLGPAAWGDSGIYICTVTSTQDLSGNNEAVAELVVLGSLPEVTKLFPGVLPDWVFVILVLLGAALVALVLGLCWCQCCPHRCCCLLRCPCCPQTCCCPEALYFAGKAATSGYPMGVAYPLAPPPFPLRPLPPLEGSQSSQVPLLPRCDVSEVTGPPPSDISSLHEPPDPWEPPPHLPPPQSRGRWRSEEVLGGSRGVFPPPPISSSPPPPPRSRSREDFLGRGVQPFPPPSPLPGPPPRRLRKHDAISRESLVV